MQDIGPFRGHSPDQERPLGGYAMLIGSYSSLTAGFGLWLRRSGRELPERVDGRDLALIAIATHKLARVLARDRVTSIVRSPFSRFQQDSGPGEVDEAARGHGLRRAIGELLICPYCLEVWVATAFLAGYTVAPRGTRMVASGLTVVTAADLLQIAYAKAETLL